MKREKRKLAEAAERFAKVKEQGTSALQFRRGPGGLINVVDGTSKVHMFQKTGLSVVQRLDQRVRTHKAKPSKAK